MKNLLILVLVLAVGLVGLGYYRGWFTVTSTETTIDISLDKTKVQADEEQFRTKAREAVKEWRGTTTETEPATPVPAPKK
jgi:hypothetical protein